MNTLDIIDVDRLLKGLRPFVAPLVLLGALEVWARTAGQGSDAIAPPTMALGALIGALQDGSLLQATGFTLASAGAGLAVASVIALVTGTLLGLSQRADRVSSVSIDLLRPVPAVALIPLAMLVFGFGMAMEVSVVAFACFWPMLVLTQTAVRQVEPRLLEVSRALQLPPAKQFISIVLPSITPRLFVALRLGFAVALVVAVTVEIAANPYGMGYALTLAQQSLEPARMMAWLLWIGLVGVAINAMTSRTQRLVARRMGEITA